MHSESKSFATPDLTVSLIDTLADFEALKRDWQLLCSRDPDANAFLSWPWLQQCFADNPQRWSVLLVRSCGSDALVGALPLKYRLHWSRSQKAFQTELECGTRLVGGPYGGLLCDPAVEPAVLARLAQALPAFPWTKLSLDYLPQRARAEALAAAFDAAGLSATLSDSAAAATRKRLTSRVVALPDTADALVTEHLSPELAQSYAAWCAALESEGGLQLTFSDAAHFDQDLAALSDLAATTDQADAVEKLRFSAPALRAAAASGQLVMPLLSQDGTLRGGIGHVFDTLDGSMLQLCAVFDPAEDETDARMFTTLQAMQWAIDLGGMFYDFGRISRRFSKDFNVMKDRCVSLEVTRDVPDDLAFDPICTGAALKRIESFLDKGKTDRAKAACAHLAQMLS
ncbi:MAG: GNAT family N-acetyltransferase [Paracoccaceae bacterium]|nr:GNAT family N-acetyltransferase [Paracoccaceae bacterium]